MPREIQHQGFTISDDPARLDATAVHRFLSGVYWSENIPLSIVQRALANSFCVGIYLGDGAQVGLIRLITDRATFAYVCDVYVLPEHRGLGLSKAAMQFVTSHPELQNLRRWQLVTKDAHRLYAQFGFVPVSEPDRHMEKRDPEVYRRLAAQ